MPEYSASNTTPSSMKALLCVKGSGCADQASPDTWTYRVSAPLLGAFLEKYSILIRSLECLSS